MPLQINPDRGDAIVIDDQGVSWDVEFEYRWNNGPKLHANVQFPAAFRDIDADEVEGIMVQLAVAALRGQGLLPDDQE